MFKGLVITFISVALIVYKHGLSVVTQKLSLSLSPHMKGIKCIVAISLDLEKCLRHRHDGLID